MSRTVLFGPAILALVGAGFGICLGMLSGNVPPWTVHLDVSVPLLLLGALVGALAGCAVSAACVRRPRHIRNAGLALTALLGASVTAPLGWIAGSIVAAERLPRVDVKEDVWHLPPVGMAGGAIVGCGLGLAIGVAQTRLDRRRPDI